MKNFTKIFIICLLTISTALMAQNNPMVDFYNKEQKQIANRLPVVSVLNKMNAKGTNMRTEGLIALYDSAYDWGWDTTTINWDVHPDNRKINFIYDDSNNLLSYVDQSFTGSSYVNYDSTAFTYDSINNLTSELDKDWVNNEFQNYAFTIYTYDVRGNQISETDKYWTGTEFQNETQYNYYYDTHNNDTSEIVLTWLGGDWTNEYKYSYEYDSGNNFIYELDEVWNDSLYANVDEYRYTYNASNEVDTGYYRIWNDSVFVNADQYFYFYNANKEDTCMTDQAWDTVALAYQNSARSLYTYNTSDYLTSELDQFWNGADSTYLNSDLFTYGFDANNFSDYYATKFFDSTGTVVTFGDSTYIYFHTVTGINELTKNDQNITVYPNPATASINIEFNEAVIGKMSILIYDAMGREVSGEIALMNNNSETELINISRLESGIYFLQIKSDDVILTRRFIKE